MITRRTFSAGLSGAFAWLTSRKIRSDIDDELLTLRPQWQEACTVFDAILAAKTPIELRFFALRRPQPLPEDFCSNKQYEAELARVEAANAAIAVVTGLDDIEQREAEAIDAYHTIVDRIILLRARTIPGLLFKAQVSQGFDHTHDDLTRSIAIELLDLARLSRWSRRRAKPYTETCDGLEPRCQNAPDGTAEGSASKGNADA